MCWFGQVVRMDDGARANSSAMPSLVEEKRDQYSGGKIKCRRALSNFVFKIEEGAQKTAKH